MQANETLDSHVGKVLSGERKFENVFQSITRMILDQGFEKRDVLGKQVYDFNIFRQKKKHLIGMYDELNSFVNFVKDASEGGSSSEMAYVLIGEPGNGKTFFVDTLCDLYRNFTGLPENNRFTFKFKNLGQLEGYGQIKSFESQTFEDPLVLAMNLFGSTDNELDLAREHFGEIGFTDAQVEKLFDNYRPLGACSDFTLNKIREFANGDIEKMKEFLGISRISLSPTLGNLTGKYPAKDKITSSSVDLLGEESIQRLLHIPDTNNPYRFDLRRGALARVGGGGIHFADEIFKNKKDLIKVYLGVIQNRVVELDGYRWPIDTLVIATSNNEEFNRFKEGGEESPIVDRCRAIYMSHNTDYKLQRDLTRYALGSGKKTTLSGGTLHIDPFLISALSDSVVLSRLPTSDKLTPIEMMKLAAGDVAGDKSLRALAEIKDDLSREVDITKRYGQKGLGQRDLGRALQILNERTETQEGKCMTAIDVFDALERVVLDYVQDDSERVKYLDDLEVGKQLYRKEIKKAIFDAYMDEKDAIIKDVSNYVNMVVALGNDNIGRDGLVTYRDPQTGNVKAMQIDKRLVNNVESRMGLKSKEQRESHRTTVRRVYAQMLQKGDTYDFMDQHKLVEAVTEVRLNSDVNNAGSLIGALANRTKDENQQLYDKMTGTMINKLGFCGTCAEKTLEYYCTKSDES